MKCVSVLVYDSLKSQEVFHTKIFAGGKCGSTYVDRNLHELMSKRFGNAFDKIPHAKKGPGSKFMNAFESAKCQFGNSADPGSIEVGPLDLGVEDSKYFDADERAVLLDR